MATVGGMGLTPAAVTAYRVLTLVFVSETEKRPVSLNDVPHGSLRLRVDERGETGDVGNQVGLDVPGLGGDGPVVRQGDAGKNDVGARIENAAAQGDGAGGAQCRGAGCQAVGDGQVVDLDVGCAAADVEDAAGVVAADGQAVVTGAV